MEIKVDEKRRVIKPFGKIDINTVPAFELVLHPLTDRGVDLIVDMSECNYLSSAGIRVLLLASKKLHTSGGVLYITNVSGVVMQIFEMAGLNTVFHIEERMEDAWAKIALKQNVVPESLQFKSGGKTWVYEPVESRIPDCYRWESAGIVSCKDLGFALGSGKLADLMTDTGETENLFISTGHCVVFISENGSGEGDFRMSTDPSRFGILVRDALSFGNRPTGWLSCKMLNAVDIDSIANALKDLSMQINHEPVPMFAVIIEGDTVSPSISFLMYCAGFTSISSSDITVLQPEEGQSSAVYTGITVRLTDAVFNTSVSGFQEGLYKSLTYENVFDVQPTHGNHRLNCPSIYVFAGSVPGDGNARRVAISTTGGYEMPLRHAFLARRLFHDASRIMVNSLHGGYSAQTFHVTSFDQKGRKMGPTVMKIADKKLILRESERCKKYALPFIFNNSAVVQGTEFHCELGGLRYNFVGIGGEESRLRWLTYLYHEEDMNVLDPLFDKVFLKILKPWYGQPLNERIYPFRDHDPTFTFFPFIYNIVNELLGVSSEDQRVIFPITGQQILNPYWYLKYEYNRWREFSLDYYTGICHGDLNMQNILVDEKMNIYLIDFSETRPRAVISDFARLEAIFLIDNAPVETDEELVEYLPILTEFYNGGSFNEIPVYTYEGRNKESVRKNIALAIKMRQYALHYTQQHPDPLPYYLALLEWTLPIVCYSTLPVIRRRLSMMAASLLCEQVMKRLDPAGSPDCRYPV